MVGAFHRPDHICPSERADVDPTAARKKTKAPGTTTPGSFVETREKTDERPFYTVNELPHPHVLFTLGLLNLKPAPSSVSM